MRRLLLALFLTAHAATAAFAQAGGPMGTVLSTAPAPGSQPPPALEPIQPSSPTFLLGGPPRNATNTSSGTAKGMGQLREPLIISGAVMTPTAYRAWGKAGLGPSMDINAAYFIGRLYGRNKLNWTTEKTNYIDRLGVWFLSVDGKMLIQHETKWVPAVSVGGEGIYAFRDAPQPSVQTPGVAVKVSAPSTKALSGAYLVTSKKLAGQFWSVGMERGSAGNRVGYLSEFLTPEALTFSGHPGKKATSSNVYFGSVILFPNTHNPVKIEYLKFVGTPLSPYLINFRIGSLLHLNFDIGYLKFKGGYDLLGTFGFRWSLYPHP